jgi:predicted ATP-grasp superfamily ATP-dependent carboligase
VDVDIRPLAIPQASRVGVNDIPGSRPEGSLSVLLASASYGGTIAAARSLSASGVRVSVVSSQRLFGAAGWSRGVARTYRAPLEIDSEAFLQRLIAIGKSDPGQILLPTSDETAWMYAADADALSPYFTLYQPSIATISRILDKKLLYAAANAAGVATLPCWYPADESDARSLPVTLPYPVLIKPRTHVHRLRNDKGALVSNRTELLEEFPQFAARELRDVSPNPLLPDAHLPMVQKYVDVSADGVRSVSGFVDRSGELFVARHATKLLQRSRPVGVGVCFESCPADAELSDAVRRLCRELGYFGIFEVEFVRYDGRWCVIDFNPRLFSQVGMDIRRDAPLPYLACLDAAGETEMLRSEVAKAQQADADGAAVFYDRFTLRALILAQTLTLRNSRENRDFWRGWARRNADHAVDFAADADDAIPGVIHVLSEIYLGLRAFPRFLKSTPRINSRRTTSSSATLTGQQ